MKRSLFPLLLLTACTFSFSPVNQVGNGPQDCVKVGQRSVFIAKKEVSNLDYKEFLKGLIDEGKYELVKEYVPDPEVWMKTGGYNKPLRNNYFTHPASDNYPVLGISHEAAKAYCERQIRLAAKMGQKNRKYRLPTKKEWEMVAHGGESDALCAGGAYSFRSDEGDCLFNHRIAQDNYITDGFKCTTPVESYVGNKPAKAFPKETSGTFHMAGNVTEMVAEEGITKGGSWMHFAEKAHIDVDMEYEEPTAWLGFCYVVVEE